jgi:hypothetical protein
MAGKEAPRLDTNHHVLCGAPPPIETEDVNGQKTPPEESFDIGKLDRGDLRGFKPNAQATSVDWEEHPRCGGHRAALDRAKRRRIPQQHRYQAAVPVIEQEVTCGTGKKITPQAHSWPETDLDWHAHLILPDGASKTERNALRNHYKHCFFLVLSDLA